MSAVMSFEQVAMLTRPHTALFCLDRAALVNRPQRPLVPFKLQQAAAATAQLVHTGLVCHTCLILTALATCLDVVRERQPVRRQ